MNTFVLRLIEQHPIGLLKRSPAIAAASIATVALGGCAGTGEGLDANGLPLGDEVAIAESEFATIQRTVFTPICTECHQGATAPHGLRLEAGVSYALLVGVPSDQSPEVLRVQPGNPDASYLVQKLLGVAPGGRMPLDRPPLSAEQVALIRQWIANGASPDTSAAPILLQGPIVTTTDPAAESSAQRAVARIVVAFDRELDASSIDRTTIELRSADSPHNAPALVARLKLAHATASTIIIEPTHALTSGTYEVRLRGSGHSALKDLEAQPLRTAAGAATDFNFKFTVETN